MARSRNIKPGFFLNDELAECEPLARLLFAGLWCIADREGRLEDRPKRIKAEVLPYDDCDIDQLLNQLAEHGFIIRYEIDGCQYIQTVNFLKHQNPHYKESESIIPPPPGWIDSNYVAFGVPEELRQKTFDRDGRKCVICGAKEDLSIDHIIPRSKGGTNDPENLQTLCRSCNSSKKNREAAAILKDKITISSANDRPMIGQSSVNDSPTFPADSLKLIPDSFNLGTEGGSGGNDNSRKQPPQTSSPNTTIEERKALNTLSQVENYPFDYEKDLQFIRDLSVEFPEIDICEEIKKWRTYKIDKPLKKKSNPRLQLRNWMAKAVEFLHERSANKNGTAGKYSPKIGAPSKPGFRPSEQDWEAETELDRI